MFVEALRYAQLQAVGYAVYFVHLIFAFMLLVYLPYSKFAHLIYRTVALIYVEYSGRNEVDERFLRSPPLEGKEPPPERPPDRWI